jgi:hypothetical protein
MSQTIDSATSVSAPASVQPKNVHQGVKPHSSHSMPQDKIQLSSEAQKALAEASESAAQTEKEAGTGDVQAQKLLVQESAAKSEKQHQPTHVVA